MHFAVPDEVDRTGRHRSSLGADYPAAGRPGLGLDAVTRTLIKQLPARTDGPVTVSGWVETIRDQKKVQFVVLRDESGALQLVHRRQAPAAEETDAAADEIADLISGLSLGSFITVSGRLTHDERVKLGGIEVIVDSLDVVGRSLPESPIAADSAVDKRLDWRFLDLRRPEQNLIFRVQTTFEHAMRSYWIDHDFVELHTPKLMASASETRAELFEVDYFDGTAYLAQSPQFYKQMAQSAGFGKIFEIGPAFRADPSFTSRHATEFTSVDAEISWIDSADDVMRMHEELLVYALTAVRDRHGEEIQAAFQVAVPVPSVPFPRIPLAEAKRIVAERGYLVPRADEDLDPEGERQIAAFVEETHGCPFVFLTHYAASIRPFYHRRRDEDATLTQSYDLLFRGVEISTGAQREHRIEQLEAQAREKGLDPQELGGYLDFFRYGTPPHGGFGMGLSRVLMLLLQLPSIREVSYLFRGPNRLQP